MRWKAIIVTGFLMATQAKADNGPVKSVPELQTAHLQEKLSELNTQIDENEAALFDAAAECNAAREDYRQAYLGWKRVGHEMDRVLEDPPSIEQADVVSALVMGLGRLDFAKLEAQQKAAVAGERHRGLLVKQEELERQHCELLNQIAYFDRRFDDRRSCGAVPKLPFVLYPFEHEEGDGDLHWPEEFNSCPTR